MNRKIGIFGGSFNPVHYGHLLMAQSVKEEMDLDEMIFVPTGQNPFKATQNKENRAHCYEMLRRATEDNPEFSLSSIEIDRGGPSYTYDTIAALTAARPAEYYFLIGSDLLYELEKWHRAPELFKKVTFVVVDRPDPDGDKNPLGQIEYLRNKYGAHIELCPASRLDISSTAIRNRVRLDKSIRYYTPQCVVDYIKEHQLYSMKEKHAKAIKGYKEKLKKYIKPGRYDHSIGVMETAVRLAEAYDADVEKAEIAGLLHDCAKSMTVEQMIKLAEENGVHLSKSTLEHPGTMHAPVGAILAEKDFGVHDKEILSAIAAHTTGNTHMSKLDKIIFLADYIEPGRTQPGVEEVRDLAKHNLDAAVLKTFDNTIKHLIATDKPINTHSIKARNELIKTM